MTGFIPHVYGPPAASMGGGAMPTAAPPAAPETEIVVPHGREVDLRAIAGDVSPPIGGIVYERDYFLFLPADGALQRLRVCGFRNGIGLNAKIHLIQLADDGTVYELLPEAEIRQLDRAPTVFETAIQFLADAPVVLRVNARYQTEAMLVTVEVRYTQAK